MLNARQLRRFNEKGYVLIENAVEQSEIDLVNLEIRQWLRQSRYHRSNFGSLIDGQPRFSLEPGHSKTAPKLRRINNPIEISESVKHVLLGNSVVKYLVPILGPNIRFDHCKINSKHHGMSAEVRYHQDHIFEPQTNDSVVVALLMINDSTVENGCLKVVPGSHKLRYSHCQNGKFTGTISDKYLDTFNREAEPVEGKAGSLVLMHTWAVHGSESNTSKRPRSLLIAEYKSADAFPLTRHKLPSRYMDALVCGNEVSQARHRKAMDFELPDFYHGDSLFDLQETAQAEAVVAESAAQVTGLAG